MVVVTFGTVTLAGTSSDRGDDWFEDLLRLPLVTAPDVVEVVRDWMTEIHRIETRYREERAAPVPRAAAADEAEADEAAVADEAVAEVVVDWQVHRLGDDAWRVTYREPMTGPMILARAYDVRRFPDGLRIVDHLD